MANMTLDEMIIAARRMARVKSSSHDNNTVGELINQGQRQFAVDVHGLWDEKYIDIIPKFNVDDNWYYRLITDAASATLQFSDSAAYDVTGSTMASYITSCLQTSFGNSSVTWDPSTWRFTLIVPTATSIEIAEATETSYVRNKVEAFFGGTGTQSTTDYLGDFPEDCTVRASLPSGFLSMEHVEWDGDSVPPAPFEITISPEWFGTDPMYYSVAEKEIRFWPVPSSAKDCHIFYKKMPDDFGNASATGSGSMSASATLDREFQYAPVYWAASQIADENGEPQRADRWMGKYILDTRKYTAQRHNQNPQMFPGVYNFQVPEVKF
jgi:hypothetical protein